MGIGFLMSSSSFDEKPKIKTIFKKKQFFPNPNPENYRIIKYIEIKGHLVVMINYIDCINYEGNKILLFKDCEYDELNKQKSIDPHFAENKGYLSPFACFEPTQFGWDAACLIAHYVK